MVCSGGAMVRWVVALGCFLFSQRGEEKRGRRRRRREREEARFGGS
jgi:hypothetical protein